MKKFSLALLILFSTGSVLFASGAKAPAGKGAAIDLSVTQKAATGRFVVTPQLIGFENAEIEVTWQPNPGHSMAATSAALSQDMTKKVEAWVKKYPNVKVVPVGTSNNINDNMTKLQLAVVEGTAPDLAAVDSFIMPTFAEWAVPLNSYLDEWGVSIDDFFPYIKNTVTFNGQLKALWYTTDTRGLYYRKDLIAKPPVTVDELIDVAKKIRTPSMQGLIYCAGRNETGVNNLWGLYWCQGAKIVNADGSLAFNKGSDREAMLNLLSFLDRTIKEGISPNTVINYNRDADMYGDVAAGKTAMFIGTSSGVAQVREVMGRDAFNAKWGFAELPVIKAGQKSTSSAGGWTNVVFAKDPLHQRLAADLAWHLYSSDEASESWCRTGGYLPTRQSLFNKFTFITEDPYMVQFGKLLTAANSRPAVPLYSTISTELQVAFGEIVTGSSTPQRALEKAITNIENAQ